jgi:hypothetical protein
MATTTASFRLAVDRLASGPLGGLAAALSLIAVALTLSLKLPNSTPLEALAAAGVLSVGGWMLVTERYEWSLAVLMLYIGLLDGFLKLKTGSDSATLGRDLLLYAIAAGALIRGAVRGQPIPLPPLKAWVFLWLIVVLVQVFNPEAGTFYHSVASLRQHIEWVPLFFISYMVIRDRKSLRRFLLLLLAVAAVNGMVGLVQFNLTPEQLADWGPGYAEAINGEGGISGRTFEDNQGNERPRPFGLGGDSSFGGMIALIAVGAGLALLSLSKRRGVRIITGILAAWVVIAIATSDARVAVLGSVICILAFAGLTVTSRAGLRTVLGIAVAIAVAMGAISVLSSNSSEGSFDRYDTISNPAKAVNTAFSYKSTTWAVIPTYLEKYPLGAGLGSGGPASTLPGGNEKHGKLNAETQPTFTLIEVGIPGLIVIVGFEFSLLFMCVTRIRRIRDRELRILLTGLAAPLFALVSTWVVGVSTATSPAAPYLWFSAGVLAYWLGGPGWKEAQEPRGGPAVLPDQSCVEASAAQVLHG